MANLYISDGTHAKYVAEYGTERAKQKMREVLDMEAPDNDDE